MIKIDLTHAQIDAKDVPATAIKSAHDRIWKNDGTISNAWVELPYTMTAEAARIKSVATHIRKNYDVFLVVGVGGSYLGAFAGIQMFGSDFPIEFLGTSFDPIPIHNFLKKWQGKRIAVNIVSKSGTTLEIQSVFEIIQKYVSPEHFFITTDAKKGKLREYVDHTGCQSFVVPDRVGGRYSVLSAVGLLPFAVAGIDIDAVLRGAKRAHDDIKKQGVKNAAYEYAAARYLLYTQKHRTNEVLASFYECFGVIGAWWQQLFGESEGKDGKSLFVDAMVFTRHLHSMGQYIQQGSPILFETVINIINPPADIKLQELSMNEINRAAFLGTVKAHTNAGVPVVVLNLDDISHQSFGYLLFFFEIACACSAYLLGVDPFDQPGVEFYKNEMKALMKKGN